MAAAALAARDASVKLEDRSAKAVVADELVIRDSIVVPDSGRVVHDRDCVEIPGERRARSRFRAITVAGPASEKYGADGHHQPRYIWSKQ